MDQMADRQWEEIVPEKFLTEKVAFVVGLNTLG